MAGTKDVVRIGNKKRIDWNAVRAEYIAGGISQRKLAEKHGIPFSTLRDRAKENEWVKDREKARAESVTKAVQKTASIAAENAVVSERIRLKLLKRLEAEIDSLPASIGSQSRQSVITRSVEGRNRGNTQTRDVSKEYKLRDLTAAWKDLTDGLVEDSKPDEGVKVIVDV